MKKVADTMSMIAILCLTTLYSSFWYQGGSIWYQGGSIWYQGGSI